MEIEQGYVPGQKIHERLRRVRREGTETFRRTIKLGKGRARIEVEEDMERGFFERMWPLTEGHRVRKRRYAIPSDLHVWEIDEFLDRELVLAEIELPHEDDSFAIPPWLAPYVIREVTDEPAYLNLNLAR